MDLVSKYGFLWISFDFVWTLLDFSRELTKVCVELVWTALVYNLHEF